MRRFAPAMLAGISMLLGSCGEPTAPDVAMREVIEEIGKGRASAIWYALPGSFQDDIRELTAALADKLDPEVYDEAFKLARDFVAAGRDKVGLVREMPSLEVGNLDLEQHAEALLDVCEVLTSSQFSTVEGVRKLDPAVLLDRIGKALLQIVEAACQSEGKDLDRVLAGLSVTVQSIDGDQCVLLVDSDRLPVSLPLPCRLIEGKWIPSPLANAWERGICKLEAEIARLPVMSTAANKRRMLAELARGRQQLELFRAARTPADIEALRAAVPGR